MKKKKEVIPSRFSHTHTLVLVMYALTVVLRRATALIEKSLSQRRTVSRTTIHSSLYVSSIFTRVCLKAWLCLKAYISRYIIRFKLNFFLYQRPAFQMVFITIFLFDLNI